MSILEEILAKDRWIRMANTRVRTSPLYNSEVADILTNYLSEYAAYYSLSADAIIKIYNDFTRQYSEHIRTFLSTGKYPFENKQVADLGRLEYDVVLILSVFLSLHRHKIFIALYDVARRVQGNVLLIGIGSGVELEFLNRIENEVHAYDISISDFIKEKYTGINLVEDYFEGAHEKFDNIFAVELLEHLADPLEFTKMAFDSLTAGGKFYFTTATNIPQIDHLYNFNEIEKWESDLNNLGFHIQVNDRIVHDSIDSKLDASNTWYVTQK